MAQKATGEPPANTQNLDELVRGLDRDLRPLEEELEAVRTKIRDKRHQFKVDSGITLADFDAARRLALIEDVDARRTKVENLRRCFGALADGETLDWISALS